MAQSSLTSPVTTPGNSRSQTTEITNPDDIAAARRAEYVAFLHRHPFATDAYETGFLPGVREDYTLQTGDLTNVDCPVLMVDNDFRDPDVDRYLDRIRGLKRQPWVCVLGDAETPEQARNYTEFARSLTDEFPRTEYVIVPKCSEAFEIIDEEFVLGYAMGYSDVQADAISEISDWRGRRVHLLGASPPKQWAMIQRLTQPTLTGDPPANIIGVDWNGPQRVAYLGEYWSRDGWKPADHLSIRKTVTQSLREIRQFWKEKDVWTNETPIGEIGTAVKKPDDRVFAGSGRDPRGKEALEEAIIIEYEDGQTFAFKDESERDHFEYHEGRIGMAVSA